MTLPVPDRPKIFHITHVDNLAGIVRAGRIWSDAKRLEMGLPCSVVGMSEIKRRRLQELRVSCHPATTVGQYVPFYFCPRSIMLYILHCGNHPELTYRGGQGPIVHLQADLLQVVEAARQAGHPWAFSNSNAGARYTSFFNDLSRLSEVNWQAVQATDFRDSLIKDGKQAEFLCWESFPWSLVEKIGISTYPPMALRVSEAIGGCAHQPQVSIESTWYF